MAFWGERRRERAVVVEENTRSVTVMVLEDSCGEERGHCAGCGLCTAAPAKPRFTLAVTDRKRPQRGDILTIERFAPNRGLVACLLFGTPLLASFAAMVMLELQAPGTSETGRGVLITFLAFIGSFGVLWIVDRSIRGVLSPHLVDPSPLIEEE